MSTNPTTQEQATMLPAIGQRWPGVDGQYIGVTTDPSGELYALVVLDARPDHDLTWSEAREWAASVGGALPTRPEGALAFANAPQVFEKRGHWLDEQYSALTAWYQHFGVGTQDGGVGKSHELRARAVRRFKLSPSALATQPQAQPTAAQARDEALEESAQAAYLAAMDGGMAGDIAYAVRKLKGAQPQAAQAVPQDEKVVALYVASRASLPARPAMWRELRAQGWPIISSWIDEAGEGETEDLGELWQRITDEIRRSCGVILYAEAEDMPLKGALIECGIAIGMGKRVAAVLPGIALEPRSMRPVGSWLRHPLVSIHSTVHEARAALASPTTQAAGEQPSSLGAPASPSGSPLQPPAAASAAIPSAAPLCGEHPIPVGTPLMQDFCFLTWPDVSETPPDPDTLFDISVTGDTVTCKAPGFGQRGDYGNGPILVRLKHWQDAHARGIGVRSTETEGLGPEGAEPGAREGTRPEESAGEQTEGSGS